MIEKYLAKWNWGAYGLSDNNIGLPWDFYEKYKERRVFKSGSYNSSLCHFMHHNYDTFLKPFLNDEVVKKLLGGVSGGTPIAEHHRRSDLPNHCERCNSGNLLVQGFSISSYHPGGDGVVWSYDLFCKDCQHITSGDIIENEH